MAVIAKVSYQRQKNNENDSLHIFSFSYVQQSLSANFVFQSNITIRCPVNLHISEYKQKTAGKS